VEDRCKERVEADLTGDKRAAVLRVGMGRQRTRRIKVNNLGGIDHELDDWSDGITDPLHEEYPGSHPVGHWDYFCGTAASKNCATPSILARDSKIVLFPAPEQSVLPLSA
jgi:hypothetical protein